MLTQWTGIEVDLEQRRTGAALPSGIEKVDNFKALRGHNRGEFAVELQGIRQVTRISQIVSIAPGKTSVFSGLPGELN